jgi:hypothetical protein
MALDAILQQSGEDVLQTKKWPGSGKWDINTK